MNKKKHSWIERTAEKLGIIPNLHKEEAPMADRLTEPGTLTSFPPPEHRTNHLLQLRVVPAV
jgi:hypothetical protein